MGSTACSLNQVYIYEKLGFSIIYPLFGNYTSAVPKLNNKPLLGGFYVFQKTFLESVYFPFALEVLRSLGSGTRVLNFVSTHFRQQWLLALLRLLFCWNEFCVDKNVLEGFFLPVGYNRFVFKLFARPGWF